MNRRLHRYAPAPTLAVSVAFAFLIFPPLLLLYLAGLVAWLWMTRTARGRRFATRFTRRS